MISLLLAMFVFSLSMSLSPGPVNIAIASSGARHGVRRTLPFVSGATIGFTLLLGAICLSYEAVTKGLTTLTTVLDYLGAAFIAYMGWKIATGESRVELEDRAVPGFGHGFVFQWINPKAWIACTAGAALFSGPATDTTVATFAAVYFVVCYVSLVSWAVLGHCLGTVLASPGRIRMFNLLMGGSLILTAAAMASRRLTAGHG